VIVLLWAITGPLFTTSVTWQLVINTGTAISTFLMIFLIPNTQNSDTDAARNTMIDLKELQTIRELACKARTRVKRSKDGVAIEG
jgi:low affinity Fe/Cu permease